LAIAQLQAALVFDQMAPEYDDVFTNSRIGRAQRDVVWSAMTQIFQSGNHILELNCGTGEDALFLARNSISVTACDASEQMIRIASSRMRAEAPNAPVQFNLLPTERLRDLQPTTAFDGAFSNFSGLNCVSDLRRTAEDLALLLPSGAPLLLCVSTRFCVWEMLWFLAHGKFRKAFRRCSGSTTAKIGEFTVDVYYPTLRRLQQLFAPTFVIRSCRGIGVTVPPSYVEPWIRNRPELLNCLRSIDTIISSLPGLRVLGDHMLVHFERVGTSTPARYPAAEAIA
ncbi:MAG TPA: class I SAM-dependent methyltransferase, partial [Edaphobacter sp.]|nr:class I SAM-dependent methyltransferase [Edaphobacter sp.]